MTSDRAHDDNAVTIGWQAIDSAAESVYGDKKPHHYGTVVRWALGGPDPLDGISVYKGESPVPHWHFVTYGLSELYDKESEDTEYSGFGLELTFRLARAADEYDPPKWVLSLLNNLARYIFQSRNVFSPGDHMDLNSKIALEVETQLTAVGFVIDGDLGTIATPHGQVNFIQIVGLTSDELAAKMSWNGDEFFELVQRHCPKFVTTLDRPSLLNEPDFSHAVTEGREKDGSSTGVTYTEVVDYTQDGDQITIVIDALSIETLSMILPGRIPFERDFTVFGYTTKKLLQFEPGQSPCFEIILGEQNGVSLTITSDQATELSKRLKPVASDVTLPGLDGVTFRIVPTEIKDNAGNVVRTVS